MRKVLLSLLATPLLAATGFGQTIHYGDEASVGKYYKVRGINMYVETYGKGKPLLLLHGNGGSIASFSETIPYFSKKYKVIAVDSRAQGKTIDKSDSLSFEMMADDFAALLDKMHIKQCYVLGWSDGGICALLMAMRHPDKVIKLAATGANLTPSESTFQPGMYSSMERQYYEHRFIPKLSEKHKNEWKLFLLDYQQPQIPFEALKAIKCPSFIICGDHDVISIPHTEQIYKHIPKARLWVVPNSEHPTLIQHKDEFNKRVDDFFSKPFIEEKG